MVLFYKKTLTKETLNQHYFDLDGEGGKMKSLSLFKKLTGGDISGDFGGLWGTKILIFCYLLHIVIQVLVPQSAGAPKSPEMSPPVSFLNHDNDFILAPSPSRSK
ncbi:hypothetical protein Tco_1431386 [Tanacetum coccineum]